MSQFPSGAQGGTISITPVLVVAGASQLTFFLAHNTTNSDGYLQFYDSSTAASTPTGSISAIEFLIPSGVERVLGVESGNGIDPDGLWAFSQGMVMRFSLTESGNLGVAPSTPVRVRLQFKP